jgi:Tfp pilus assembly protein PilW
MPSARVKRLIQGQGGSTLVELVVAMPIALLAIGLSVQFFASAHRGYREVQARATAQASAQVWLERMTRELRQADWVYFRNSQVVDMLAPVRVAGASTSQPRLVRFTCGAGSCTRSEGPATAFPPPAAAALVQTTVMLSGVANADFFHPQSIDPDTGLATADFLDPDSVILRAHLKVAGDAHRDPYEFELHDGVSLRNRTRFTG